jgi:hypothetical protein
MKHSTATMTPNTHSSIAHYYVPKLLDFRVSLRQLILISHCVQPKIYWSCRVGHVSITQGCFVHQHPLPILLVLTNMNLDFAVNPQQTTHQARATFPQLAPSAITCATGDRASFLYTPLTATESASRNKCTALEGQEPGDRRTTA